MKVEVPQFEIGLPPKKNLADLQKQHEAGRAYRVYPDRQARFDNVRAYRAEIAEASTYEELEQIATHFAPDPQQGNQVEYDVRAGDRVAKKELLAQIDAREFELAQDEIAHNYEIYLQQSETLGEIDRLLLRIAFDAENGELRSEQKEHLEQLA